MKVTPEYVIVGAIIAYIAFFTHPPPRFVAVVLASPVGQVIALLGVVAAFMKSQPIGLLLGVAYLVSSYPVLEYLDATEQSPAPKEQPKSGAPKPDMKDVVSKMLAGKGAMTGKPGAGGKLVQEQGKSETKPPTPSAVPKPHTDPKVTEKFSMF